MPDSDALQASRPTIKVAGTESSTLDRRAAAPAGRARTCTGSRTARSSSATGARTGTAPTSSTSTAAARLRQGAEGPARRRRRSSPGRSPGSRRASREGSPPSIAVLAEDRLQDLRMTRRTRTFADMTDADVLPQIASDHGLTPGRQRHRPDAQGARPAQPERPRVPARARAGARRASCGSTDTTLSVQAARGPRRRHAGHARLRQRAARVHACSPTSPGSATSVDGDRLGRRPARARSKETATDSVVERRARRRRQRRQHPLARRSATARTRSRTPCRSRATRRTARAEALFEAAGAPLRRRPRHRRDEAPSCGSGATLKLDGLGPLFEGDYYVTDVAHRLRRRARAAHRVRRSSARDWGGRSDAARRHARRRPSASRGRAARWYGVYPALVTDITDPDGQGRVKVDAAVVARRRRRRYEAWARLATLMGGNEPRHLVRPRHGRRGAGRVRGRRPAPALRARRAVERHRLAARVDGRRRATTTRR